MSTFPFLSLPVLAQNVILKNLTIEDLIFLSICSKRAYCYVKTANITLRRIKLEFDNLPSILVEYPYGKYMHFSVSKWNAVWESNRFSKITLNGVKILWIHGGSLLPFYTERVTPEQTLELVIKYFWELFRVNKLDVCLRPGLIKNFFLWKMTKSINELEIDSVCFPILRASGAEVKFAVEDLNVKILKIIPSCRYSYEDGLKQEEVYIEKAFWLHVNALLNSESSRIWLSFPRFDSFDLNLFVKNWLAGIGLENFKHLFITYRKGRFIEGFQEKVLEGIETVKWDPRNRPESFEEHNLGTGRDFKRADGTWATVRVDEENFIFHVWK